MEQKFSGMTVNERLVVSGLIKKFDKAVRERNIDEIVQILKSIEVDDAAIDSILEKYGLNR